MYSTIYMLTFRVNNVYDQQSTSMTIVLQICANNIIASARRDSDLLLFGARYEYFLSSELRPALEVDLGILSTNLSKLAFNSSRIRMISFSRGERRELNLD